MTDLDTIYRLKASVQYDREGEDSRVRVITEQNHLPQRIVRKLGFHIPRRTYRELDAYGSLVFLAIDGKKTAAQIGEVLVERFPETQDQLEERLNLYLHHLEANEGWIETVE